MADRISCLAASFLFLIIRVSLEIVESTDLRGDDLVFSVYHSVTAEGNSAFKPRGSVHVKSVKSSLGTFTQKEPLSLEDIDSLKELASRNGYYRIKVQAKSSASDESSDSGVSTFVKACSLFKSRLTETITLSVDNTGHLYGVGLMVPNSECQEKTFNLDVATLPSHFNTSVVVLTQTTGQLPDTQTYIQRLEKEKRDQAAGKTQDNRSFLAKYWMYIVPVVIFMMLSSQQPEQQGEGSN